jgi:hypothetical protein
MLMITLYIDCAFISINCIVIVECSILQRNPMTIIELKRQIKDIVVIM